MHERASGGEVSRKRGRKVGPSNFRHSSNTLMVQIFEGHLLVCSVGLVIPATAVPTNLAVFLQKFGPRKVRFKVFYEIMLSESLDLNHSRSSRMQAVLGWLQNYKP